MKFSVYHFALHLIVILSTLAKYYLVNCHFIMCADYGLLAFWAKFFFIIIWDLIKFVKWQVDEILVFEMIDQQKHKMTRWRNDSFWNDKMLKWKLFEMTRWWNDSCFKITKWCTHVLMKWKVNWMTVSYNEKLTKWRVDKMICL